MIHQRYLEIIDHTGEGYKPCIDYGEWRVAVLRFTADVEAKNITYLERHNETDEVFVLLEGNCTLLIGEGSQKIKVIQAIKMDPYKLYNVKKGTYHHQILSRNAQVLLVENNNTGSENSDRIPLSKEQIEHILSV
jgi:ureidoglycolate hydrolase